MITAIYVLLCLVGAILPFSQFLPWLSENGLNLLLAWQQIGSDALSAFAWADLLVSSVAAITFIIIESRRIQLRHYWLPIAATCIVGLSLGLPLFLLMRHRHLQP